METVSTYYGLDWLAMALSVLAVVLLGNKSRWGFVAFILANLTWIALGLLLIRSYPIVLGNALFLIINVRGYRKWATPAPHQP